MNPITLYLTAGAMSLAKCQLNFDLFDPVARWPYDRLFQDQRRSEERSEDHPWRELKEEKSETVENEGYTNYIFRGLQQLNKIYDRCKSDANQIFEKTKKKVKSPPGKYLSELKENLLDLYKCVKVSSFRSLDEVLEGGVVRPYFGEDPDGAFGANRRNATSLVRKPRQRRYEYVSNILSKDWTSLIYDRLNNFLRTSSLKFQGDRTGRTQGRGRRRDHRMFAMMVMGFMIMASILIPMGFQFLTVLGGKSLLMAKMALIMSAINGLKKIATSNVGYGFYHTGAEGHHHDHLHHGFHEKLYHAGPQNPAPQYGGFNP